MLPVRGEPDDDTLKSLLSKSDLVVIGKITSEPIGIISEFGVLNYSCVFHVQEVLKGDGKLKDQVIKVNIARLEMDAKDKHPLITKDGECILFLKNAAPGFPSWVTADFWFGVQHPSPRMARSLQRLAAEQPDVRVDGWPTASYTRVIGYMFDLGSKESDSLLNNGQLREERLQKSKKKEVELNASQVKRLLSASFASKVRLTPAACYNPRHIFVFYDSDSKPVAAIEICFGCDGLDSMPVKETNFHHDFEALARLSVELGLGLGSPTKTLDSYLEHLKSRDED